MFLFTKWWCRIESILLSFYSSNTKLQSIRKTWVECLPSQWQFPVEWWWSRYCNRDCQKLHCNSGHEQECEVTFNLAAGVKVGRSTKMSISSLSMRSGKNHKNAEGTYRKPDGIDTHERFVVKVQGGGTMKQILVYDDSRSCEFRIDPETSGFNEIRNKIQKEMAWDGRKLSWKLPLTKPTLASSTPPLREWSQNIHGDVWILTHLYSALFRRKSAQRASQFLHLCKVFIIIHD